MADILASVAFFFLGYAAARFDAKRKLEKKIEEVKDDVR